ncbi:MAG: cysteine desulfurase CsdA [Verrucomicrobia bacterium]|nr:MAG: cysteine desulfurase CsdA [Verrucomicrobiota bacterium]
MSETVSQSQLNSTLGSGLDVDAVRRDFPILDIQVGKKPLVYLDSAATAQKPQQVTDTIQRYYMMQNANIHRGVHYLSQSATDAYEESRRKIATFFNAATPDEIVFVRGTTEAINLVAQTWGRTNIKKDDEILISELEHHANIVPWQILCEEKGARLKVIPIDDRGRLKLDAFEKLLTSATRLLAITHISNAIGTVNPIREMIRRAHALDIPVLIDGAQSAPHLPIDLQALDCDFYVCSGHKLYGPTGIGILYAKYTILKSMPPYQGGGDMIQTVTFEKTTYKAPPERFEAGTPNIAGVVGLGAAIDYVQNLGRDRIARHETDLIAYAEDRLATVPGLKLIGSPETRAGALSFVIDGAHPHDIGTILDSEGIAIRAGHHCAQPLMRRLGLPSTARASFACYNTHEEIDALEKAARKVQKLFN